MLTQIMDYLDIQGLTLDKQLIQVAMMTLQAVQVSDAGKEAEVVWQYPIPFQNEMVQYDLMNVFRNSEQTKSLLVEIQMLINSVQHHTGADWVGCYGMRVDRNEPYLVKLAYKGNHSTAEIPVNQSYAYKSNISRVALTGWGAVIEDISQWTDTGEIDTQVKNIICMPVCTESGSVLGIVEAKSFQKNYLNTEKQEWIVALALVLSEILSKLRMEEKE